MERQFPIQFRVLNQQPRNVTSAPRHQRHAYRGDRGRYPPTSNRDGGNRTTFFRNPKHPKNIYDVELSMRKVIKGKPVKLTPGLAFPDPKLERPLNNPRAPRLHFEFNPAPDDYNIVRNPLMGAIGDEDDATNVETRLSRYISTADYASSSDSDDDRDSADGGQFSIQDDDDIQFDDDRDSLSPSQMEVPPATSARKLQPYRTHAQPPPFEPQPPPPKALVNPVLVIPRAVVREEQTHPELKLYREHIRNGSVQYDNNNHVEN